MFLNHERRRLQKTRQVGLEFYPNEITHNTRIYSIYSSDNFLY